MIQRASSMRLRMERGRKAFAPVSGINVQGRKFKLWELTLYDPSSPRTHDEGGVRPFPVVERYSRYSPLLTHRLSILTVLAMCATLLGCSLSHPNSCVRLDSGGDDGSSNSKSSCPIENEVAGRVMRLREDFWFTGPLS